MRLRSLAIALLGTLCATCRDSAGPDPVACLAVALPSLFVTVIDANTHQVITAGATGSARAGGTTHELVPVPTNAPTRLVGPYEVSGTFTVSVSKPGYHDLQMSNVVVTRGPCGVITLNLAAWLAPTSP